MVRVITLLLLISPLSFAGDNSLTITTKGTGSSITAKQVGNGNTGYILCGANSSGSMPGTTYSSHTCGSATLNTTVIGHSNNTRLYTVWSNNIDNNYTITVTGNDNFVWLDQDEDDNTSTITQTGNDNHAEQLGSGDDNVYSITQTGNDKYAKIFTFADDSDFTINQYGTGEHNTYIYNYPNAYTVEAMSNTFITKKYLCFGFSILKSILNSVASNLFLSSSICSKSNS